MLMPKIVIFYYPEENLFRCKGKICVNLQPLVTPNQIFLFKHDKKSIEFVNREFGVVVRMLYPVVQKKNTTIFKKGETK